MDAVLAIFTIAVAAIILGAIVIGSIELVILIVGLFIKSPKEAR